MGSCKEIESLLLEKSKLYDQLILNLKKQNTYLNPKDHERLSLVQNEWNELSRKVDKIDLKVDELSNQERSYIHQRLENILFELGVKAEEMHKATISNQEELRENMNSFKKELTTINSGSKTLGTYRNKIKVPSSYIDKKY